MKKILLVVAAVLVLGGCRNAGPPVDGSTSTLESRVESFYKPDRHGVVCYQDLYSSDNLACVQVTQPEYTQ